MDEISFSKSLTVSIPNQEAQESYFRPSTMGGEEKLSGPIAEFSKWEVRVGDAPKYFKIEALHANLGIESNQEKFDFYKQYELLLVPHRVGVRRISGSGKLKKVCFKLDYDFGFASGSIEDIFPRTQFLDLASVRTELNVKNDLNFTASISPLGELERAAKTFDPSATLQLSEQLKVNAHSSTNLRLSYSSKRLQIGSMGVGSKSAVFEFTDFGDLEHWTNLECWTIVAVPKGFEDIVHTIKTDVVVKNSIWEGFDKVKLSVEPVTISAVPVEL